MRLRFELTSGQWAVSIISGLLIGGGVSAAIFAPEAQARPAAGAPEGIATLTPMPSPTLTATPSALPTLEDVWEGRAIWQLGIADVGLPIGESDTLISPDGPCGLICMRVVNRRGSWISGAILWPFQDASPFGRAPTEAVSSASQPRNV